MDAVAPPETHTHSWARVAPHHTRYFDAMLLFLVAAAVLVALQNGLWVAALVGASVCFWVQYWWSGKY